MTPDRTQVKMLLLDIAELTDARKRLGQTFERATKAMQEFSLALRRHDEASMDEGATEAALAGFKPYVL